MHYSADEARRSSGARSQVMRSHMDSAAIAGGDLGFAEGAGAGQAGVQKAEDYAEQDTAEDDIDEAHGLLLIC